jgi:hypothetical protein
MAEFRGSRKRSGLLELRKNALQVASPIAPWLWLESYLRNSADGQFDALPGISVTAAMVSA